jgi:hypothetical protein
VGCTLRIGKTGLTLPRLVQLDLSGHGELRGKAP